jgi:DNA-binding transcriptional ArsR family regulator
LKLLANENRLLILCQLLARELSVNDLAGARRRPCITASPIPARRICSRCSRASAAPDATAGNRKKGTKKP